MSIAEGKWSGVLSTEVVNAPSARKNSRFLFMFEGFAMLVIMDMLIWKVSRMLICNEKSLVCILRYWIDKALKEDNLEDVKHLAIDKISFKRGHSYMTVVVDAGKRRVKDVEPRRKSCDRPFL